MAAEPFDPHTCTCVQPSNPSSESIDYWLLTIFTAPKLCTRPDPPWHVQICSTWTSLSKDSSLVIVLLIHRWYVLKHQNLQLKECQDNVTNPVHVIIFISFVTIFFIARRWCSHSCLFIGGQVPMWPLRWCIAAHCTRPSPSLADLRGEGRQGRVPSWGSNSFIFHAVLGKNL